MHLLVQIADGRPCRHRCRRASRRRGPGQQIWISSPGRAGRSVLGMTINAITHSALYVLDQDEALDFYVGKLGFEVNTDQDLGFMRWLRSASPATAAARSCWRSRARRPWTRRPPSRSANFSPRARSADGSA
ncbi:VOC family protein [Micromonospora nigra]|uniref:VOC family protein n=1 Tax=Micromonospora nigra TaxID=145857 RepID=UPI00316ADD26